MDPNETLRLLREAVKDCRTAPENGDEWEAQGAASAMAEHFEALDEWLTSGGFLPLAWVRPSPN